MVLDRVVRPPTHQGDAVLKMLAIFVRMRCGLPVLRGERRTLGKRVCLCFFSACSDLFRFVMSRRKHTKDMLHVVRWNETFFRSPVEGYVELNIQVV